MRNIRHQKFYILVQFSSAGAFKFFDIDVKYLEMPLLGNLADIAQEEGVSVVMSVLWHKNQTLIILIAIARLLVNTCIYCSTLSLSYLESEMIKLNLIISITQETN